jgi:hypothetical protein
VDYADSNESSLSVALKVGMAFDDLRERVIADFAVELEKRLAAPHWRVSNEMKRGNLFQTGGALYIGKLMWNDFAWVAVAFDRPEPRNVYFQIPVEKTKAPAIDWNAVKKALDSQYLPGKASVYSHWWRYVDRHYRDWTDEDVLLRLWRKEEAVRYFAANLEKIAEVLASVIDVPLAGCKEEKVTPETDRPA